MRTWPTYVAYACRTRAVIVRGAGGGAANHRIAELSSLDPVQIKVSREAVLL